MAHFDLELSLSGAAVDLRDGHFRYGLRLLRKKLIQRKFKESVEYFLPWRCAHKYCTHAPGLGLTKYRAVYNAGVLCELAHRTRTSFSG